MPLFDKTKNPDYVKMEESLFDSIPILSALGNGPTAGVLEPVPEMLLRPTDYKINSNFDSNAAIVFGRDRHPQERSRVDPSEFKEKISVDPSEQDDLHSGYSRHQGAGAIDIVVGRGAPYPVKPSKASKLPPLYTTITDPKIAGGEIAPGNKKFTNDRKHNGVMMDAARIYLSQMSDVDKYFKISKTAKGMYTNKPGTSAIILKADGLRMHARRDIKIIAGGDYERGAHQIDSAGNILLEHPKIHIMVGNGKRGYTDAQPVPMGNNLIACIEAIYKTQQNIYEVVNLALETQKAFNTVVQHYIPVVAPGQTGPPGPVQMAMGKIKLFMDIVNGMNVYFEKFFNNPNDAAEFLNPFSKKYILSRSVFINSRVEDLMVASSNMQNSEESVV